VYTRLPNYTTGACLPVGLPEHRPGPARHAPLRSIRQGPSIAEHFEKASFVHLSSIYCFEWELSKYLPTAALTNDADQPIRSLYMQLRGIVFYFWGFYAAYSAFTLAKCAATCVATCGQYESTITGVINR